MGLLDANEVTLDKMAEYTQSEDILKRYEAYGWDTYDVDGHDLSAVEAAISAAKANKNGKPKFIKCNTIIGKGMEETEGTNAAHGEAGVPYVDKTKIAIGIPEGEKWYVSQGTRDYFKTVQEKNKKTYDAWQANFKAWEKENPALAKELSDAVNDVSGSADLHGSTRNYINDGGNFGAGFDKTYAGRNMYFGIREHAMGAILNGIAYHGIFKA